MPEISWFLGIKIEMFWGDHPPAHFHATYAGQSAQIGITPFTVIAGKLPGKVIALLAEWTALHEQDLLEAFAKAARKEHPGKIEPLV